MRRFIPLVIFIGLVMVLALNLSPRPPTRHIPSQMTGKDLPDFELPLLDGNGTFSNALWQGKLVVLHVFASWCVPCAQEHDVIKKLAAQNIPVYGIAWRDKAEAAKQWLLKHSSPYLAVGYDEKGRITTLLGLTGTPETMVISAQGKILLRHPSILTDDVITRDILPLFGRSS